MQLRLAALITALGFSSGVPLALIGSTLQVRLAQSGVSISNIGLTSLFTLPYSIKFVVAPLFDRYALPFLGLRRGWMVVVQIVLAIAIAALGAVNPLTSPLLVGVLALLTASSSALQDIVIDAYRTEITPTPEDGGWIATLAVLGYRLGMLTSGAVALFLAEAISWESVYLLMALSILVGVVATLTGPEPQEHRVRPGTLLESVINPLTDFMRRPGAIEVLAFLFLFKASEFMAVALRSAFLVELGFANSEIATFSKIYGLAALIVGGLVGGAYLKKTGMKVSLLTLGTLQALSFLLFSWLAVAGKSNNILKMAVAAEEFVNGMATSAVVAFMMSLCSRSYTATQYALLSSLVSLPRTLLGASSGYIKELTGWFWYFTGCSILAIPALLLLLWRYDTWYLPEREVQERLS